MILGKCCVDSHLISQKHVWGMNREIQTFQWQVTQSMVKSAKAKTNLVAMCI